MQEPESDPVNPSHYHGDLVMRIIEEFSLGFCDGCAIKYILRYQEKGGVVDLEKARWYLDRLIAELKGTISVTPFTVPTVALGSGSEVAADLASLMNPTALQVMVNALLASGAIAIAEDGTRVVAGMKKAYEPPKVVK